MPRQMPRFDNQLARVAQTATAIARAGEISALCSDRNARQQWTPTRLESLYELAFLRVFASWEMCLEGIFYRTLCGYSRTTGREVLHSGRYYSTLGSAESAVLSAFGGGSRGATFLLWHDPQKVIRRCQQFVSSGTQEIILTSNVARLEHISRTRHRIVHDSLDAKTKFDSATRGLVGTVYPRSRPGKFLRDLNGTSHRQRWLETIANELVGLLQQMV